MKDLFIMKSKIKKGIYICFEGSEGVGKTTQVKILVEYLRSLGYLVFETKEPGTVHSPLTMKLRQLILDAKFDNQVGFELLKKGVKEVLEFSDSDMTSSALVMITEAQDLILNNQGMNLKARELITQAIRNIHLQKIVKKALPTHDYVIQDRGVLSGLSYGKASGVETDFMYEKNTLSVGEAGLGSDWTQCYDKIIILQGNVASGLKRAQSAKQEFESGDVMEKRGTTFLDQVNDNFNYFSQMVSNVGKIVVDGKTIEEVSDLIKAELHL
jgi:thymidylate kinase